MQINKIINYLSYFNLFKSISKYRIVSITIYPDNKLLRFIDILYFRKMMGLMRFFINR